MGSLFSGGDSGSPPEAPTLRQVGTKLTDPLYTRSAHFGDKWARLMRSSYGLAPPSKGAPASWEAQFLGPGAKAMMGQAALPFQGRQDPQLQDVMQSAGFGRVNLGSNPYEVAQNLGQQFSAPLGQLQRNQTFLNAMLNQWKPPDLRLTGEDLLNVAMGQAAQRGQAQQQAFESQLLGATSAAQQQGLANAATLGAIGKVGSGAINAFFSPSLSSQGYYQPSLFASLIGGTGPTDVGTGSAYYGTSGGMDVYGPTGFTETGGSAFGS